MSKHYHKILLDESLVRFVLGKNGYDISHKSKFPEVFSRYFSYYDEDVSGYLLPFGYFHDYQPQYVDLEYHFLTEVCIPADLFKFVVKLHDVIDDLGVACSISDVVRFMMWTKYPASFTPEGFNLIGDCTSCLPDLAVISKTSKGNIGIRRVYSQYIPSGNVGSYHRYDRFIELPFAEDLILSNLSEKDWTFEFSCDSILLPNGIYLPFIVIEVLRRVDSHDGVVDGLTTI